MNAPVGATKVNTLCRVAELKTSRNDADVAVFIDSVDDPIRRDDARRLVELLTDITECEPTMWGPSIIGFGEQHLVYDSGRELDWMRIGFSPRKAQTTIYLHEGFDEYSDLLDALGPHKTAKSCLYLKRLDQVDGSVLRELLTRSFQRNSEKLEEI